MRSFFIVGLVISSAAFCGKDDDFSTVDGPFLTGCLSPEQEKQWNIDNGVKRPVPNSAQDPDFIQVRASKRPSWLGTLQGVEKNYGDNFQNFSIKELFKLSQQSSGTSDSYNHDDLRGYDSEGIEN